MRKVSSCKRESGRLPNGASYEQRVAWMVCWLKRSAPKHGLSGARALHSMRLFLPGLANKTTALTTIGNDVLFIGAPERAIQGSGIRPHTPANSLLRRSSAILGSLVPPMIRAEPLAEPTIERERTATNDQKKRRSQDH